MKNNLKNIFKNKKRDTLILFLLFIGIFLFFGKPAHAEFNILAQLLEAPIRIAVAIVVLFFTLALGVLQMSAAILVLIAATFLQWLITAPIKLTSGGVVQIGWDFCRDIANMFFIIFLLVIAYATIFRKETYAMKALLPTLIIIALVINFSQVLCGVIVDVCNILMNFFIKYGVADVGNILVKQNPFITDVLKIGSDDFWVPLGKVFTMPFAEVIKWMILMMIKAVIALIFTIFELLVILAYGLVLTIRIVIIWILVILSPIAFASYVLPLTRGWWKQWWGSFVQWALLGVIMLFFLYLAGYILQHVQVFESCQMNPAESDDANINAGSKLIADVLCSLLPPIMAMVLLVLGLLLGLSGTPGFVQTIMKSPAMGFMGTLGSRAKETARVGGATLGLRALGRIGTEGSMKGKWTPTALGNVVKGLERTPIIGGIIGGQGAARTLLESKLTSTHLKGMEQRHTEDLADRAKDLSKKPVKTPMDWAEIRKIAEILTQRGKLREFWSGSGFANNKMAELLRVSQQLGADILPMVKQLPELADVIDKTPDAILGKINDADYAKLFDPDSIRTDVIFNNTGASQLNAVLRMGTAEQKQASAEKINGALSGAGLAYRAGSKATVLEGMNQAAKGREMNDIRNAVKNAMSDNDLMRTRGFATTAQAEKFREMIVTGIINK